MQPGRPGWKVVSVPGPSQQAICSQELTCCAGWRQQGDECGIAVCEGNSTCSENEVCVRPGECRCRHGYFGANCDTKCPRQFWGPDCKELCVCHPHGQCEDVTGQCGQCKGQQPCTVAEGRCLTCEPGWNGTKCDQPCATGFYGEGCGHRCPPCRDGHACNHVTGKCTRCNAGWIGDRCETKCSNGTYGEDCAFVCADCGSGHCDFQSGRCLCSPGVHGPHCNLTCPPGLHGVDCAQACSCHEDSCDPVTGACRLETNQRKGVMGAGALLALLLGLLLSLLGCCCACRGKDPARGFLEPPSGLEQPSPSWSSRASFSSFDTTDEGPVYCVPHEDHPRE
ncbi:Scavenger receptor class F member 2, partial [Eschrichtius robustus]|nr:Scavenger receptor class F member 2 [Eschrichtius robustus]